MSGSPQLNRVVVTGGTRWVDRGAVEAELERSSAWALKTGASFRVLTGMADGADAFARAWADAKGVNLFAEALPGDGGTVDVLAYNDQLLALEPDLVLAFKDGFSDSWDSAATEAGTEHMCRIAARAGVPVLLNGERWLSRGGAGPAAGTPVPAIEARFGAVAVRAVVGDITQSTADVIVNAANSSLLGGGGVDGAIHRAAGPMLLEECRAIALRQGGCAVSQCVLTGAGSLKAKHVIHTVGPVWTGDAAAQHDADLAACYAGALELASTTGARSVAFPCISTGVYRFPKDRAAAVAVEAVKTWAERGGGSVRNVEFICFSAADLGFYSGIIGATT